MDTCAVEVVHHDTGGATVVLTWPWGRPDPVGVYWVPHMASGLRAHRLPDVAPDKIRWIEHRPAHGSRAATVDEVSMTWDTRAQDYHHPLARRLTPAEIRQLGMEPDEVEMVAGELVRRGVTVEHEGHDVRVDGYAVSRDELRALVNASHGNVDEFLRRFEKMRNVFE